MRALPVVSEGVESVSEFQIPNSKSFQIPNCYGFNETPAPIDRNVVRGLAG